MGDTRPRGVPTARTGLLQTISQIHIIQAPELERFIETACRLECPPANRGIPSEEPAPPVFVGCHGRNMPHSNSRSVNQIRTGIAANSQDHVVSEGTLVQVLGYTVAVDYLIGVEEQNSFTARELEGRLARSPGAERERICGVGILTAEPNN
jgi:hypothetical protein